MVFIAKLTVRSTCFGHHYAHHQELKSYTSGCCLWYVALWFTGRWSLAATICITLELLMMGIMVPKPFCCIQLACYFPHISDAARSNSHQIKCMLLVYKHVGYMMLNPYLEIAEMVVHL